MKNFLETTSKVVFWVFVGFAVWTVLQGVFYGLASLGGATPSISGIVVSGVLSVVLYFLASALTELGRMHSDFDQKEMLEGLANVASRISERARAAAQKEEEKEKEKEG